MRKLNGGDIEGRYAYTDWGDNDNDGDERDDESDDDDDISDNEDDDDDEDDDDNEDEDDSDGDNDSENEYDGDYGHSGDLYDGESPGPEREHREKGDETRRKEGKGQEPLLFWTRGRLFIQRHCTPTRKE